METLRFLMVSTHFPPFHMGGDAVFVQYLSDELIRRGHEVSVHYNPKVFELIRGKKPELKHFVHESGPARYEFVSRLGKLGPLLALSIGWWADASSGLLELAEKLKPDVVHWHNTKGFIGRPIAVDGAVNLYTAHDFYSVCPRSNLLRPGAIICEKPELCQLCLLRWKKSPQLWRVWQKRAIRFPPQMTLISPSEFVARRLAEDGIKANHILRNFVPDKRALATPKRSPTSILYLGVLEVPKGPQTLLEAFSNSSTKQGFNLYIMGDGSLRESLEKKATMLGLANRVKIPGFIPLDEMGAILKETAAVIIPTIMHENAPLVALEAFSMGIPVIGSNLGGLPEILGPESGSMQFQGLSANSLEVSLCSIWNQKDRLLDLGKKARNAYEERYSPEAHIRKYLEIIGSQEELATGGGSPSSHRNTNVLISK